MPPTRPTTIRRPGPLPSVSVLTAQLSALSLEKVPSSFRPVLASLIEAVTNLSRIQHLINARQWDLYASLPAPHALTHMGGDDSVEGTSLPSEIIVTQDSAIGDPTLGYAPIDHVHGTEDLAFLNELEEALLTARNEISTYDSALRRALERLLLLTIDLKKELLELAYARSNPEFRYPTWEDLRFPAQGIDPGGAAASPTRDNDTGLLIFSAVLDNVIAGVAQMPHAWLTGTSVRPHLHLRFPTSNAANTRWKFEYDIASTNGNFSGAMGTYKTLKTITIPNPQNVLKSVIQGFGDLDMTGFGLSSIIMWKISRLRASDAEDTDANTCALMEFDIHYQSSRAGSPREF